MEKARISHLVQVIISLFLISGLIIGFSIPINIIPSVGNLLLPGGDLYRIQAENSEWEQIQIPDLSNKVTVYRDQWGIPHIYGFDDLDIFFALGYCHAQDRLFQMDMGRRMSRGRLAEILGPELLELDQYNLNMLKDYWTLQTVQAIQSSPDPEVQKINDILTFYAAGVNSYIDHNKNRLPTEYQLLGIDIAPWTIADSLSFSKYMSEDLTWGYEDILNLLLIEGLGSQNRTELYNQPMPYQIPINPGYGDYPDTPHFSIDAKSNPSIEASTTSDSELSFIGPYFEEVWEKLMQNPHERNRIESQRLKGSNNWVVNGSKTATGFPILCNDMHLSWDLPGIWYEAHLINQNPESLSNIYGFFIAGTPSIVVGHNDYVGWGYTNVGYDVLDIYYYNANESHYLYNGEWIPFGLIEYEIPIKNQASENYVIKTTVHGPVFEDVMQGYLPTKYHNYTYAVKWTANNVTWESRALMGFAFAHNRSEFNDASRYFHNPAQNIIYADKTGHIAIRSTGLVPIRNDSGIPSWHTGNGSCPYNGSAGQGEWIGYIPFEDLPSAENPAQQYLCSANQIVAGPDYFTQYTPQHFYDDGYRARRINQVLANNNDITLDDMKDLQTDIYSVKAGNMTPILLTALDGLIPKTDTEQEAYDTLAAWNYQMDQNLAAPSIFDLWLEIFIEQTFKDDLAACNVNTNMTRYLNHAVVEDLLKNHPDSHWFDKIGTPLIETRDDIIKSAFQTTIAALTAYFETNSISNWQWGKLHQVQFTHLSEMAVFNYGPVPWGGDGDTVTPSGIRIWREGQISPRASRGGASERLIVDFSNLNNSISIIPSGERGIAHSKHYTDQLQMFLAGQYHPQYFGATTSNLFQQGWIESTLILNNI